jgi:hypothetical protein
VWSARIGFAARIAFVTLRRFSRQNRISFPASGFLPAEVFTFSPSVIDRRLGEVRVVE